MSISFNSKPSADDNKTSILATMPKFISLDKWADSGFEWKGQIDPASFDRLRALLSEDEVQQRLQIEANLYRYNNVLHFGFKIKGAVWLTCQRCLLPITSDLSDDYDVALLEDESQACLLDGEQDYLLLTEVLMNQNSENLLPFEALIEDEILLKIPMAPKHDNCEMKTDQFGDIPEEKEENPFAALMSLKGKLSE